MNSGNDSNCVHWSYATVTGTSTTMSFWMRAMTISLLSALDELSDRTVPGVQELVRIEHVVLGEDGRLVVFTLHDRDARLTADGACELHDERLGLRRDAAHRAARETRAAGRALHRADPFQDGPDPVHAVLDCTSDA